MAVTKIWPVKDSLSRLIEYAENPEKTAFESLETVMAYAGDEDKVIYEKGEKCYLVTALNCRGNALESMIKVQKHFGAKGENIAYHAYQSFKPGEVTPEQCHEIGVKLAEKLWGNRYQVLVATHTNCSHLHNHYVISAVSFRDGKKLDTGNNYWGRVLSPASDALCREYGLSTLGKRRKAAPRVLYMDEKKGKKTPYRLMFDALKATLGLATSNGDLQKYLYDMGYELDIKKARMRSRFTKRWVSLKTLSDMVKLDEMLQKLFEMLDITNLEGINDELRAILEEARRINEENERISARYNGSYAFVKTYTDAIEVHPEYDKEDIASMLDIVFAAVQEIQSANILILQGRDNFISSVSNKTITKLIKEKLYGKLKLKEWYNTVLAETYANLKIF